jgi:hydrogenase expression/formation protein HypE
VLHSIAAAARRAQVRVVAGDTKVVPRGAADGLFITTSGIGALIPPVPPGPSRLEPGDVLIVSGPIGRHGIAILAARENLGFDPPPLSDCGPLAAAVEVLRDARIPIRCMRDATRGGVAAVLHEWSQSSGHTMTVSEANLPISCDVRGACELLGLDPLHIACEGTLLLSTPAGFSEAALEAFRKLPETRSAARIGEVHPRGISAATVRRALGTEQPLDDPAGAPLPRIC